MKTRRIYRFGPYGLDATVKVLLRDGEPIHAPRKAVETLLVLLENSGQIVTKEELIARLWPGRVVNEANLAQNIAVIRRVLHVEAGEPGFIENFPGTGYRVLGPITATSEQVDSPAALPGAPASAPAPRTRLWRSLAAAAALCAVLAAALYWVSRAGFWSQPEGHRVPVTRLAGKEFQPAVSPDGSQVAFVWDHDRSGIAQIYVQTVRGDSPVPVPAAAGDAIYYSPAWSPDGRRLAYLRFAGGQGSLEINALDGSAPRTVAALFPSRFGLRHRHLDWSPDGRTLAVDDRDSASGALGLFSVSIDTGLKKRLTRPDDLYIGDVDPRFSPDGRTISFIRAFHRAGQEVFIIPASGGEPRQITRDSGQVSSQDWTPDGAALVFGSNRDGDFRLWRINPGTRGARPEATAIFGDFPLQLALARRAPTLVYAVLQEDLNIWRLDLTAPHGAPAQWTRLIASSGLDASPQYSPTGDRICFRSDRSGEEQLWVASADGAGAVQITRGLHRPSVGRWSPDGRAIAFNSTSNRELFIAHLDDTAPGAPSWRVESTGRLAVHPVFSPDGKWIFAGTEDALIRIPVRGGPSTPIVPFMGISLEASADGQWLYFVREPSGTTLWRANLKAGRAEQVLDGLVPYCSSCWAPAAAGIYYLGRKPGAPDQQAIFLRDLSAPAAAPGVVVADYPEAVTPIGAGPFSLSPDGRYLLCVRADRANSDIFRVEPFR